MRYDRLNRRLGSKHFPAFWKNNIPSLAALYEQVTSQSIFIAIDFEGFLDYENNMYQGITEVGLAVLYPEAILQRKRQPGSASPPGLTLEDVVEQNGIQVHSYSIKGRHRTERSVRRREPLYFGQVQWVEEPEIEATLVTLLTSIQDEFDESHDSPPSIILVGYAMDAEFAVLNTVFPHIISGGLFSAWMDLQEITNSMCEPGYKIGLQDVLLSLGFARGTLSRFSKRLQHCAGNDVARELALLVHLFHYAYLASKTTNMPALRLWCWKSLLPKKPQQRICGQFRPQPFHEYPFTVCISLKTNCPPPKIDWNEHVLNDMFSDYHPTATAMRPDGLYGWVCLPTEEVRAKFMVDVEGKMYFGHVWKARALSCAERRNMRDMRKPGNERVQENKQRGRRAWRDKIEAEIETLSLGMFFLDNETM